MKSVIKTLKLFCSKLVDFSNTANELMEMTEELRSFSTESGMKNFSVRSRVKIRNFSEKATSMTASLEDFSVMSDDMLRDCPGEHERLARKLRMTHKCFSELESDFKEIQKDVKDAVELAVQDQPMSKSAPSNPPEKDLQGEDTSIDSMKSTVNGAMPEATKGDANISGPSESVNNNFSKDEYLKSLFNRIADQYDNFSDKLNDAGDLVEEVTDEVVAQESPDPAVDNPEDNPEELDDEEVCPDCGKKLSECKCAEVDNTVLDNDEDDPDKKRHLVKTEDDLTGEESDKTPGDVSEFCSRNFSESVVTKDKSIDAEVHKNLAVLNDVADAIKSGSLGEVNKSLDKLDDLEKGNKNFAAITACALMCFSEICKECGQVIPGTEDSDKVESSEEETKTEETKTEDTPKGEVTETTSVTEALDDADKKEDENNTPSDEEIIMNFSAGILDYMDTEFKETPPKSEGENEAKPDAGDAPDKKEGLENMTDVAPIHPDAVKIALFSVMDKCDEFKEKKASLSDVIDSVNFAKLVMIKSYPTPEIGKSVAMNFAEFCNELGLSTQLDDADNNATKSSETTVNPVEESNSKLNGLVETIKGKLEDLDLDSMTKTFATKLCDEFSSTKCFTEEDVINKMNKISSFSEDLEKITGVNDVGDVTGGDDSVSNVTDQVEAAVERNDSSNEAKNDELNNTELSTITDASIEIANFSKKTQSVSYGSRMLDILGIR